MPVCAVWNMSLCPPGTRKVPKRAGKKPACAGNPSPVYGDLPLFSFIFFIITSTQCSGDRHNPKVLALGSLSAVGGSFFQWLCCRNPVVTFLLVVHVVRQELQGQHGLYIWLLVTYRGFSSDLAYHTDLFTMKFDGFFSWWCFHKKCSQNPVSACNSSAVGILPLLQ